MNVLQVVPSISAESSGPSYSVPGLCSGLCAAGCDVRLYFAGDDPHRKMVFPYYACPMSKFPHPRLGRSPELLRLLKKACRQADVIHSNSLWMYPNVYPAWAVRDTRCKLVTTPRGTLTAWSLERHKWRKRLFGVYAQYAALKATDLWHATSESEYEEIRGLGYKQPICILPNGIDISTSELQIEKFDRRRMFFLSRIHPKKNVDLLIRVWASLEGMFPDWDLSIVGPDDNAYAVEMKGLARRLGCRRVRFEGELRGLKKQMFVASSECLVLPTHSENFGMVVAEALALGIPVICSHGAPWNGLCSHDCGWWIPTTEIDFKRCMSDVMRMPRETLSAMGKRGREWMKSEFDWSLIGRKMKMSYEWLLSPQSVERPDWVVVE